MNSERLLARFKAEIDDVLEEEFPELPRLSYELCVEGDMVTKVSARDPAGNVRIDLPMMIPKSPGSGTVGAKDKKCPHCGGDIKISIGLSK